MFFYRRNELRVCAQSAARRRCKNTGAGQLGGPENPLCSAKVHHVGEPFTAKLVETDDSFLPSIRPGEKLNTGGERTQRM